jgi:aminoacylase
VYEYKAGYPVFVLSLPGSEPSLPSILLNSHYDVVPVMRDHWHHDPFAEGKVIARGAQDMKCVCTAYLESLLRLKQRGYGGRRTIHAAFQPDEETGGLQGMAQWIQTDDFRRLNVGFALDEGLANPADCYTVFYGERAVWWTRITATGPTGHGSRLIPDTATEKLMTVVNRLLAFRKTQVELLHDSSCRKHELGDVVTVNLTMLRAGVTGDNGQTFSVNVIPMTAEAAFDIRIPPSFPLDDFEQKLKDWTADLTGISYDFYQKVKVHSQTSIDPQANPYWKRFTETMASLGRSIDPQIFPAGTDGRYLRELGIPVLGFSPIRLQPVLLHDHNESLSVDTYLEAVKVYDELIPALADMQ